MSARLPSRPDAAARIDRAAGLTAVVLLLIGLLILPERQVLAQAASTAEPAVTIEAQPLPELRAVISAVAASLSSGSIVATADNIQIRGVTRRETDWLAALAELEAAAPASLSISADVFAVSSGKPTALICRELFVASTRQPIRFQLAGDALRTASYAALDRLAEFAADCPQATIAIIGHSDSVGDPAFNIDLSQRRAQSVANYLADRGVEMQRLEVSGAGASEPVADNDTNYGRRQNRRIEFRVSLPN